MPRPMKRAMLVYQAGIANVFAVRCLNLCDYGRDALRLYQGDFHSARMYAVGLGAAGVVVRTAACNMAGDIARYRWTEDLQSQPFAERLIEISAN